MVGSDRAQSTPKPPSSPVVAAKPHTTIMSEGKGKTRAIMLFSVVGLAIGALISTSLITTYWQISERQSQLQIQAVGCPLCTFPAPFPYHKNPNARNGVSHALGCRPEASARIRTAPAAP